MPSNKKRGKGRGRNLDGGDQGGTQGGGQRGFQGGFQRGFQGGTQGGRQGHSNENFGRPVATIYSPGKIPEPSSSVSKTEDAFEKKLPKNMSSLALKGCRPGYGTKGKKIILFTNYMTLEVKGEVDLYQYSIDVGLNNKGEIPPIKKSKRLVQLLLEQEFAAVRNSIASDSRSNIISVVKLDNVPSESTNPDSQSFPMGWGRKDESGNSQETYNIKVKFTGIISISELINYLRSSSPREEPLATMSLIIQVVDIIMGHYPKSRFDVVTIGGNKHIPRNPENTEHFQLGGWLEAVRGYSVSVRPATERLLVNVQIKNVAVYEAIRLTEILDKTSNFKILERFLKGIQVELTHFNNKEKAGASRQKSICAFANEKDEADCIVERDYAGPDEVQFLMQKRDEKEPPEYITVSKYFKKEYGIITNPSYPVINVGSIKMPTYLPAEVCKIVPGQPARMKLSADQTAKMIKFAVRYPGYNANSIVNNGAPLLGFAPTNDVLRTFGLAPDPKLITVPGRILDAPAINYGKQKLYPDQNGWNLTKVNNLHRPATMNIWAWVMLDAARTGRFWPGPQSFLNSINTWIEGLKKLGISVQNKAIKGKQVNFPENRDMNAALPIIEKTIQELSGIDKNIFLLIVLPNNDTTVYNAVKYYCDVKYGLRHVCVLGEKFKDDKPQYNANVALKVNSKLGGINQYIEKEQLGIISDGKTMLVGIDVTHPSPGSADNAPSVAAIVASTDSYLGQWPAELSVQEAKQEKVDRLKYLLESRLKVWKRRNNTYPDNIIVYRDGVSEGQYDMVTTVELPQLKDACKNLYNADRKAEPLITVVVVGKRHNTRFYATTDAESDRSKNPLFGTVVDRGVTESRLFDFYLQSHTALQGTARPAHYIVVHDEVFRAKYSRENIADRIQEVTHRFCFTFSRATKAIGTCTAAKYADMACDRSRCYLSEVYEPSESGSRASQINLKARVSIHPNVKDTMFYI